MVSTAMAVLPVWRSPIINSRCPLPMGIMESMAFKPVCKGSFTGWRAVTPKAFLSTGTWVSAFTGPFPSTGTPKGVMTLPRMASPTGTSTILPVRLTISPSLMVSHSPKMATPTLSSSRFNVMPIISPGNSTSSPAITWSSPYTRAIPSPTWITSPIWSNSIFFS